MTVEKSCDGLKTAYTHIVTVSVNSYYTKIVCVCEFCSCVCLIRVEDPYGQQNELLCC